MKMKVNITFLVHSKVNYIFVFLQQNYFKQSQF